MHEPHVPAVGLADEEVHVEVREIRLGNEIILVEKLLSGEAPPSSSACTRYGWAYRDLHIPHLAITSLQDGEESSLKAVKGLLW